MIPTPKGFEIALNIRAKMLWLRIWGSCDSEFEKRLELALRDKILELGARAHWKIRYVLVDASRVIPIAGKEEISEHVRQPLMTANQLGIIKVAYVSAALSGQWYPANGRDGPQYRAFTSRKTALEWLLGKIQSGEEHKEVHV